MKTLRTCLEEMSGHINASKLSQSDDGELHQMNLLSLSRGWGVALQKVEDYLNKLSGPRNQPSPPIPETLELLDDLRRHRHDLLQWTNELNKKPVTDAKAAQVRHPTPDLAPFFAVVELGDTDPSETKPLPAVERLDHPLSDVGTHETNSDANAISVTDTTPHDAADNAKNLAGALSMAKSDHQQIPWILPSVTHPEVMELRAAYKATWGLQDRGVNIAKHIRMKIPGVFGKIDYVTALGRWESEAYSADYSYQSSDVRRELLIETLLSRTNQEIKLIKASSKDKRYNDNLTRCMKEELKVDKFQLAVFLALDEQRQEKGDVLPSESINEDTDKLHEAIQT